MVKWFIGCCGFKREELSISLQSLSRPEEREELPIPLQPLPRPDRRSMLAAMSDPTAMSDPAAMSDPTPTSTPTNPEVREWRKTWTDATNPGVNCEARIWSDPNDTHRYTGKGILVTTDITVTSEPNPDYHPEGDAASEAAAARRHANTSEPIPDYRPEEDVAREAAAARRRANNKKKKQRQQAKKRAARDQSSLAPSDDAATSTSVSFDTNTDTDANDDEHPVDKIDIDTNGNTEGVIKEITGGIIKGESVDEVFHEVFDDYYSPLDEDPDKHLSGSSLSQATMSFKGEPKK
ncbi:hypothetical protein MMC10_009736 [Thelotrema lepadinum]|nr:hypothetical protein [Thelotrema lepadinum]